ncbi:hypothetical protein B0H11DRAFT_2022960 [Mycena galericulata]|nr:hypothetical protein B0H11DRAFT_2022960 [Mycena galericulata]
MRRRQRAPFPGFSLVYLSQALLCKTSSPTSAVSTTHASAPLGSCDRVAVNWNTPQPSTTFKLRSAATSISRSVKSLVPSIDYCLQSSLNPAV